MTARLLPITAMLAALAAAPAVAEVYVIANNGLQIGADEVRDVFLGERQFAGAQRLIPVDNATLQEQFLARALRIDGAKYHSMWTKKSFREGLNPPAVKSGDAEVADYVRRTPGAIGYVGKAPGGVVVLKHY